MSDVSILVVDDDDTVRTALRRQLSKRYDVVSAAGGDEAIAALSERHFDIVISDLCMPDHDGIQVLDFAREQHDGIIRILLTSHVDERARAALLLPDAPFKVNKPWHDQIEVTVARALEQRRRTRQLSASLAAAFSVAQLESSFDSTASLEELAELLALRGTTIEGVTECVAVLDGRVIAGHVQPADHDAWQLNLPIDGARRLRLIACGHGEESRDLMMFVVHLAQQRTGTLTARPTSPVTPPTQPARSRLEELMRQATIGACSGAVLHDVAGILQGLGGAVLNLMMLAEDRGDTELLAALEEVRGASDDATELFVAMRKYLRDGRPSTQAHDADALVSRLVRQVGGLVRERATLHIHSAPGVQVKASPALCVQVLDAILRNAASASPSGGTIDLHIHADPDHVRFTITDDGPGIPDDLVPLIFETCAWHRPASAGTGLSMAAHILAAHGGTINYTRAPGRGACFTVTLPRAR